MSHRILVVDPHALSRMVLAEQLATLGHAALSANDGEQALALLESGGFALAIVACAMPGLEGFAFAARVRDMAMASGEAPCVVVGYSETAALHATLAAESGMQACLQTPVSFPELSEVLRTLLPTQRARTPQAHATAQWALFVATTREDLRLADAYLREGNIKRLRDVLHRIKGASLMLGETDLAAACARAEAGCEEWGAAALASALELLQAQVDVASLRRDDQWEPSR